MGLPAHAFAHVAMTGSRTRDVWDSAGYLKKDAFNSSSMRFASADTGGLGSSP